jgi:NADH:ubiquinone oxidoreductase subunit 5 (subunit L)/multisubunit Na+/H+ antiporter MnhA subunit
VPNGLFVLENIFGAHRFTIWLEQSVANAHAVPFQWVIALGALALAIVAIIIADRIYRQRGLTRSVHYPEGSLEGLRDPVYTNPAVRPIWSLANARLYWDETYSRLFEQPFNRASKFLADIVDWAFLHDYVHNTIIYRGFNAIAELLGRPVDLGIIDGIVNGVGRLAQSIAGSLRNLQTGYVRIYAISLLLGVVLVIIVLLLPLLGRG